MCGAVLLLSTCEYLFYSPAFMPVVAETTLNLSVGTFQEEYDGEVTSDGTFSYADPIFTLNTTSFWKSIPALDAILVSGEQWTGVTDYLNTFFPGRNLYADAGTGYVDTFHGSVSMNTYYSSTTASTYDLPYTAVKGISDGGPTSTIDGSLAVVTVSTNSSAEVFNGEGTFIFANGPDLYGLVYMFFEHGNGVTTVIYATSQNSSGGDYFPPGTYDYVINCFPR